MAALNQSELKAIHTVAGQLGVANPTWLKDMIFFETAGTNSPTIKNPLSSARGLIQFMDSTARNMGFSGSKDLVDRYPTFEAQLAGPVFDYLKPYRPFNKESDLYMAVFYPAARRYGTNTTFEEIFRRRGAPATGSGSYANFIKANPGILSPAHYVAHVKKKPIKRTILLSTAALTATMAAAWAYLRIKRTGSLLAR